MRERLRVGLIGAGGITRAHIPGYLQCQDRAVVVAIADAHEAAAAAARQALGGGTLFSDWRDLLDHGEVDAVDICLPHDLHEPVAVAAAEAGKHILVEKPIARNLREADAMLAAADRADVILMVCHDRRYHPEFARIKTLLEEGVIGRPLCLRLDHNQYIRLQPEHWIFQKERLGGGAVMSCLTHQFDLMRWYGGDVATVGGLSVTMPERMEGEIIGVAPLRFTSGAVGDAVINWHMQSRGLAGGLWYELVWLSGTDGNLHNWNGIHVLRHGDRAERYETVPVEAGTGHSRAIAHFIDCAREGRRPLTDGRAGRAALEIAMAAYRSEQTGRFVDLPLRGDDGQ
jgi:UDP-N-acetyl-2-amino-2-deoxyglucuronate dehydrogenase